MLYLMGVFLLLLIGSDENVTTAKTFISTTITSPTSSTTSWPTAPKSASSTNITATPSYSPATASETSNTQTVNSTEPDSTNYVLAWVLGFGLEGGLLLVVTLWLTILTTCACRIFREHKYSLIDLQKQVAEMRKKIERNRYDYIEFVNGAKDSTKRQGENIPYENVGQFTEA